MDRKTHILVVIIVTIITVVLVIFLRSTEQRSTIKDELKTLKFVQVFSRHGKRTPVKACMFPKDPYRNYTYFPLGNGALTNEGKQQMYNIGKFLRQRYDGFLSDYYLENEVKARAADVNRLQMSLQLALTGLYPPKRQQIWKNQINWQPIPYKSLPLSRDKIFESAHCRTYKRLYREFMNTAQKLEEYQKNKEFFDYISLHTGWNATTAGKLHIIYDSIKSAEEQGLIPESWAKQVYPDKLKEWSIIASQNYCGTDTMKRIFAGYLLKHLIREIQDKIDNKFETKISLYSGHDINVIGLGCILNLFEFHIIPYSATLTIELHQINDNYIVKFNYQACDDNNVEIINQLYNETIFTLDELLKFVEPYLPEESECEDGLDLVLDW